jgi:hypothetical protein
MRGRYHGRMSRLSDQYDSRRRVYPIGRVRTLRVPRSQEVRRHTEQTLYPTKANNLRQRKAENKFYGPWFAGIEFDGTIGIFDYPIVVGALLTLVDGVPIRPEKVHDEFFTIALQDDHQVFVGDRSFVQRDAQWDNLHMNG